VVTAFASVKDPALRARFKNSNDAAIAAYKHYSAFIKTSVVPRARASYAIGAAAYEHLERLQNVADIPLAELLSIGEANLAKDKAAYIATARQIDPNATPQQVAARFRIDRPAADAHLRTGQADLNDLVACITEKHI